MNAWVEQAQIVLRRWSGGATSPHELWAVVVLGTGLAVFSHTRMTHAIRTRNPTGSNRSAIVVLFGLILTVAVTVAVDLHVAPRLADAALQHWLTMACPLVVVLALVVPISAMAQRLNYFEALFAAALSVAAAIALGFLVRGAFQAGRWGLDEMRQAKEHRDATNRAL